MTELEAKDRRIAELEARVAELEAQAARVAELEVQVRDLLAKLTAVRAGQINKKPSYDLWFVGCVARE